MKNFLLIHGSWHGAWCWYKITPRLEAEGHHVIVPDLPGRGRAPAKPFMVGLETMIQAVGAQLPRQEKTTIVVHSRYGILASSLAERFPERIERTIYVASFMLPDGKRVLDYMPDYNSKIKGCVAFSKIGFWDWLDPAVYREALYADCSLDDVELANCLLVREPVRPALTRLRLSESRYGCVPRAYIRLTQDYAISLNLQDRLLNETTVDRVESIKASHSAYFSRPDELTQTILSLARD